MQEAGPCAGSDTASSAHHRHSLLATVPWTALSYGASAADLSHWTPTFRVSEALQRDSHRDLHTLRPVNRALLPFVASIAISILPVKSRAFTYLANPGEISIAPVTPWMHLQIPYPAFARVLMQRADPLLHWKGISGESWGCGVGRWDAGEAYGSFHLVSDRVRQRLNSGWRRPGHPSATRRDNSL